MKMLYSVDGALMSRKELAKAVLTQGTHAIPRRPRITGVGSRVAGLEDTLGGRRGDLFASVNDARGVSLKDSLGSGRGKKKATAAGVVTEFAKVGIGKPLSVEIREIYTGKYPRGLFGGAQRAMLLTTAMKGMEVFNGAARAVNFLTRKIKPHTRLRQVDATTVGTPVVYYSPALTQIDAVLTVDIAFNEFPNEAFEAISTAATTAAGIPAFATAGPYLVVAGTIISLLGKLGEAGFDSKPDFTATVPLTLDRPGDVAITADYRLCMSDAGLREIGDGYRLNDVGCLVRKDNGQPYEGDSPYVVLSIDGREHPERKTFAPTAATADMVKTFFGSKSMSSTSIEVAMEGMKLYSDWQFHDRALSLDKQLNAATEPAKKNELRALRNAVVKNIGKEELKPKFDN